MRWFVLLTLLLCGTPAVSISAALGGETAGPAAPTDIKETEKQFQESLVRLCQVIAKSPEHAPIPVDLGGWPALQVPACAVAGIVLLGEGNTLTSGPHSAALNKLFKYTVLGTQGALTQRGDKDSWLLGFGILFLAEVQRASPSLELKEHLSRLVKRLESGQNGENGWRHGLEPEKGDYGPFIGVSMWCAAALGAAKETGVPVTEANLKSALDGLKRCVGQFGGANYYAAQASRVDPGRSGGIAWVLRRFPLEPCPEAERALKFLLRNVEYAPQGHGSQAMCFGRSALAAAIFGPESNAAFWKAHLKTLQAARQADGGFLHQPWRDYDFADAEGKGTPRERTDNTTWPDKMYGHAWAGVWMLLAWQSGLGKCVLASQPKAAPPTAEEPAAVREKRAAIEAAEAEAGELIRGGKAADASKKLDMLLKDNAGHARLLLMRACACLPALAQPPGALDAISCADGKDGWGSAGEAQALSYLERALRARDGKGLVPEAYDAGLQMRIAHIHGKRLALSAQANPKSPAWVPLYNTFTRSIDGPLKNAATQRAASQLLQAVLAHLPQKTTPTK